MGTLCVVATPIGNLEDISPRALRSLAEADRIFAEDTRRTRILLDRYQIDAKPISLHEHNEASRIEGVLELLREGRAIALVSDAGTPLVSDPGGRLVAAAIEDGHEIESIPGPSAVLSALTVAGLGAAPFTFLGFLPRTKGARAGLLNSYLARPETLVIFESPRRVHDTLLALAQCFERRRGCVARELTKLHEEIVRGSLGELAAHFADGARGEITIVVEGGSDLDEKVAGQVMLGDEELTEKLRGLLASGRRPREIAALVAGETAIPRKQLYAKLLALKDEESP
ncbi:MAG: 16S rRNA (cytidine(1402)-2'-O)-methyltransferase [Myxococcales bacterium]|nr:16S rRNA (cytidine(1402)-2'-O)-methyltransferase [Myxococcales bacterium]MCH7867610.1 16S rRNA (cytidine(1402)-2'-O)-methyltransferase [Myxococcales bacterium]